MSGICAVLRLDGQPAQKEELAPVLAKLAARGPDGAAIVAEGAAALGHALLATTPEALHEPMPFRHPPSGCVITADVRLDNRSELIARLGVAAEGREVGDGELILLAYLRWGLDCPTHLLGDLAFALWDPRHQRLFCARDKVGMRQLIYHNSPGRLFACATDADALIRHMDVPRRINEARIADFIEQLEAIDLTSTFFEEAFRLPPAHALVVENGTLRQWRYWALTPSPIIYRACDADYEAAFLEVFTEAVRARLRSPDPVGSMLSGGMDSGSVTATAARLLREAGAPPLQTFSGVDDDPACKESACIRDSVQNIAHIAPTIISLGDPDSFRDEVSRLIWDSREPFDGQMAMLYAIYLNARRANLKVMLDGVGGDTSLSVGNVVAFHLGNGRVREAWAEARALEWIWGNETKATKEFVLAARKQFVPETLRNLRRRLRENARARRAARDSLVHPELAARVNMPERRRINAQHLAIDSDCDQLTRARRMLHPRITLGRERYDRVASTLGIEPRDPFMDVRVLEFCLSLPVEQLHGNGWAKLILRRAMADQLPDSVRWKKGRDHVGWRFIEICTAKRPAVFDDTLFSLLPRYTKLAADRGAFALQCSDDGIVSEADLLYLTSWIEKTCALTVKYGD